MTTYVDSEEKFIDAPIHPPLVALFGPFRLLIPCLRSMHARCVPGLVNYIQLRSVLVEEEESCNARYVILQKEGGKPMYVVSWR
jgi:hypothetical protein